MMHIAPDTLADRIRNGDVRAAARLMRALDDGDTGAVAALKVLYPLTGRAHIIGLTGNPGSGKSTLTDRLITHYRRQGLRVGVVAVDPSSPFSGGAILGDRIRMQRHATDPGVFIRSLATRGHLGGLSRSTFNVAQVLDAMGFDVVLVETVGVGQDEVDIVRVAHTAVVILVPGLGDEIQAIKAGILEIADVFVVNKADRDGADRTVQDLRAMQALMSHHPEWLPEILRTVAARDEGVPEVVDAIARHRAHLLEADRLTRRARARDHHILLRLLSEGALDRILAGLSGDGGLERHLDDIAARRADPYSVADRVLARAFPMAPSRAPSGAPATDERPHE